MRFFERFVNQAPYQYSRPTGMLEALAELEAHGVERGGAESAEKGRLAAAKLKQIHNGELPASAMSDRELRALAWALNDGSQPISAGPALKTALMFYRSTCRPKQLNGLIHGFFHARGLPTEYYGAWAEVVRHHLATYNGNYEFLVHWKRFAPLVFAPDAAAQIGRWCLAQPAGIEASFQALRIPLASDVGERSLKGVVLAVAAAADFPARTEECLHLAEARGLGMLKFALDTFLRTFARKAALPPHKALITVAIRKLGDPRLKRNVEWGDVSDEARRKLESWLSREDLDLFFRSVAMDDDRRQFWLRYVDQMTYSRLVLGAYTLNASDPAIKDFLKQGRHARLDDSDPEVSAFIFQIGAYMFVEFSQTGDACYMYEATTHPLDLNLPVYVKKLSRKGGATGVGSQLKVKLGNWMPPGYPDNNRDNRILHMSNWYQAATRKLSFLGIRRK